VISPADIAGEILRRRGRSHLLLLCDFDGTLCEFNPSPEAVHLSDERRGLLASLSARACCTVGLVTGRRLSDVRVRAGDIGDVYIAGFHGLEIESPHASFVHPDATGAAAAMKTIAARVAPAIRRLPGVFIEDKGLSLALHYRDAEPAHHVVAQSVFVDAARADLDAGLLRLLPGSCVVELLPNTSWNKGAAVDWIVDRVQQEEGVPVFPVYIGDDVTDAPALAAVRTTGVAIAASPRVTGGEFTVDGPADVERLLAALDAELHC
jgi:trehalose-phosphatase